VLARGLEALQLSLTAAQRAQLLDYVALLAKWNRAYNLTAVRDPIEMVRRHLLDSLAVLPYVVGPRVLDIGTGAGLPGIPLACALPEVEFTLLDSHQKKIAFVRQAIAELHIRNAQALATRIEDFHPGQKFATLIARAFASLADMLAGCELLLTPGVRLLAMKGTFPKEELASVPPRYRVVAVHALRVPGLDAARHVVVIESNGRS
jgi:16S rRNA (guanine527-N7)-methyltransferase